MVEIAYVEEGVYFDVYIMGDVVVKRPKKAAVQSAKKLDYIASVQTYLSERVQGVLPCQRVGMTLVMPKAPGVRADKTDCWSWIRGRVKERRAEINRLGFELRDCGKKNVFYCAESKEVYLIDFHNVVGSVPASTEPKRTARHRR